MDTHQLRDVLTRDLGPSFGGVYPRDLLPEILPYGKAIVINTDPHDHLWSGDDLVSAKGWAKVVWQSVQGEQNLL